MTYLFSIMKLILLLLFDYNKSMITWYAGEIIIVFGRTISQTDRMKKNIIYVYLN